MILATALLIGAMLSSSVVSAQSVNASATSTTAAPAAAINETNSTVQVIVRNLYVETVMGVVAAVGVPTLFFIQLVIRSRMRIVRMRDLMKRTFMPAAVAAEVSPGSSGGVGGGGANGNVRSGGVADGGGGGGGVCCAGTCSATESPVIRIVDGARVQSAAVLAAGASAPLPATKPRPPPPEDSWRHASDVWGRLKSSKRFPRDLQSTLRADVFSAIMAASDGRAADTFGEEQLAALRREVVVLQLALSKHPNGPRLCADEDSQIVKLCM